MEINIFLSALGTILSVSGIVYAFLRNFKEDIRKETASMQRRQELTDERLFKLAMGYSFERLMTEERAGKNKTNKEE